MIALLDVNVLVAMAWPNHVHHGAAVQWFSQRQSHGWATCPLTQSGFVRVSSNRRILPTACSPGDALSVLDQVILLAHHVFWSDDISIVSSQFVQRDRLIGYRQITDAHLLALAIRHGGQLATFDGGVADLVPSGMDPKDILILL